MTNWQLYLQLTRDIGTLVELANAANKPEVLAEISARMDACDEQLQEALKDGAPS